MEQSAELRDIIAGWFDAIARGDTSWVDHHVSRAAGVRLIRSDPVERLPGERAAEFLNGEVQAIGGSVTISHGETEAYREGSVGWGVTRPTINLPNGKAFSPRWSAVFHQEDGKWKLVQLHASVGVSNEQLL